MSNIGPQIPEHLKKKLVGHSQQFTNYDKSLSKPMADDAACAGIKNSTEIVPSENVQSYGPQLPEHLVSKEQEQQGYGQGSKTSQTCPEKAEPVYGPSLPPMGLEIQEKISKTDFDQFQKRQCRITGPLLPSNLEAEEIENLSGEEEDELIGPMPITDQDHGSCSVKNEIENRANAMKLKLTAKPETNVKLKRETWMTELPPELSGSIGLTARKFKTRTLNQSESDRSVWTDTPADREKKRQEKSAEKMSIEETDSRSIKDKETEKNVEEYNQRKRPMTLLEMHNEKRQKEGTSPAQERKPFDRERDLAISGMDSKAKANFIRKSKSLNSRFQEGKTERKFL